MDNDNFTEVVNIRKITESVLDYMDDVGFSTDFPIDPEYLRITIDKIIRDGMENQGVRTYSIGG